MAQEKDLCKIVEQELLEALKEMEVSLEELEKVLIKFQDTLIASLKTH